MHIKKNVRVMSTSSGTQCAADTVGALLLQIVDDVLQTPLYWSKTLQSMVVGLSKREVTLITFGPSNIANSVRRSLNTSGIKVLESEKASSPAAESPPNGWEDIAVIGMSCRLPGSGDLDEFWKVLETGSDMHTKVGEKWRTVSVVDKNSFTDFNRPLLRSRKIVSMWIPTMIRPEPLKTPF